MKRIKIKSYQEVKEIMKKLDIEFLHQFFIKYETLNNQMPEEEVIKIMETHYQAMEYSLEAGLREENYSQSGLIQDGTGKMDSYIKQEKSLLSKEFSMIIRDILAVSEGNACMKKIVAAPTAGAAGVMPGPLINIARKFKIKKREIINALFVAGGIGEIISLNASVSGAMHGCQAEVGSASAMTAAAISYLFNKDVNVIESAAAFALKNLMGLVCDPVAGLVEVPCVKRNVIGGINAIACAEMTLSGIRTTIKLDEVIKAMAQVGATLPASLKETSLGGIAISESAKKTEERLSLYHSNNQ